MPKTVTKTEIESLIYLLDDPDTFVRDSVMGRLYELGEASIPLLDEFRSKTVDANVKSELGRIIHEITYGNFQLEFADLVNNGLNNASDLEDAVFLLSRFENPTIRTRPFKQMLDDMAEEIGPKLRACRSEAVRLTTFLAYMYQVKGFRGCETDYLNPENSFLHKVLQNRKGIPLSLAFVILFVAHRLRLPFSGMNMPLHFLVQYEPAGEEIAIIDPFNNGGILTKEQCMFFLKKSGINPDMSHFSRATPMDMFSRFIRNLINGYAQLGDELKSRELSGLLDLIDISGRQSPGFE